MTTIAYRDGVMAADTLAMDAHGLIDYVTKVYVVEIGGERWLFGSAGENSVALDLRESVRGLPTVDQLLHQHIECDPEDKNAAMVARGDEIYVKSGKRWRRLCTRSYHALGSGRDFALAAMHLNQNAYDAVAIACMFDGYSGGPIETRCDWEE